MNWEDFGIGFACGVVVMTGLTLALLVIYLWTRNNDKQGGVKTSTLTALKGHELTIEQGTFGPRWSGYCECSDPDWTGDGWDGQVDFYGETKDEIREQHFEHVLEVHK